MVIDSHALLWWLERSNELSDRARELLDEAESSRSVFYVSGITFWELHRKVLQGILVPRIPVTQWPSLLGQLDWLHLVNESPAMWLAMAELNWKHKDPADRLIAATAQQYNVPVLTRDRYFHSEDSPVTAVW